MTTENNTILHLGLGSFHRAHQAVYLQAMIDSGDTSWCIAGGNIRPEMPELIAALQAQNGEYTLETVSPAGERKYQVIKSIARIIPWDAALSGLISVGAAANTRIISFTVTEAGYYLNTDNRLDESFADLVSDLSSDSTKTIYGAISAILRARKAAGNGAVTLMSCDNLRSNGDRFHLGLTEFLTRRGEQALLDWLKANASFPNGMVDRITPRPAEEVKARVLAATGRTDACPLMAESFIQWVIEDHFCNGRPQWEKVGVEMVESVLPYEEAKIRLLNSQHSCVAWAGALRGMKYIHEATQNASIRQLSYNYATDDVIPCLSPSPIDLAAYRDTVLDRFSNPNIQDTIQRVAADGFSKIAGFIVPTLRERLEAGASMTSTSVIPALFFVFLQRWAAGELHFEYQDQSMDPAAVRAILAAADPLAAFNEDKLLWGDLAGNATLLSALRAAHEKVQTWLKGA